MPSSSPTSPSRSASRGRRTAGARPRLLVLAAATATGLGLLAVPPDVASAAPSPQPSATGQRSAETQVSNPLVSAKVVTLITGDRVALATYGDGTTAARLLPGSPDAGKPVRTVTTPAADYVVPRLSVARMRVLDASLFDVTALARHPAQRVAVRVTFAPGATVHAVPGLTLERPTAHRAAGGATTVLATYDASTGAGGAAGAPGAGWQGVTSVSLPSGQPQTVPSSLPKHTLTVTVRSAQGKPVRFELGFVQNVDDGRRFMKPIKIVHGVAKVSVPEGDYAVFAGSFTKIVQNPDFPVTKDTSVSLNLADATAHPTESIDGLAPVEADFTVLRRSQSHGSFGESFTSNRFVMHVQPASAHVPHGSLQSTTGGVLVPKAEQGARFYTTMAYPDDVRAGIPKQLGFTHAKGEFAVVRQRFFANGPAGTRFAGAAPVARGEGLIFYIDYPVRVPSSRTVWLQGDKTLQWLQDYMPIVPRGRRSPGADLMKLSRYTPGAALPVNFGRNPVGPGVEAAYDADRTGPFCLLCRDGDVLHGEMPLFDGSGAAMDGLLWARGMGSWSLSARAKQLAHGYNVLAPHVSLPADKTPYVLTAVSKPGARSWELSTSVTDRWTFTSGSGTAVVPLLMPSYVPRTGIDGSLPPGPTTFALDFGNLGPVDAAVAKASVRLSTDGGTTWHPAKLTRDGKNSFTVAYTNPAASGKAQTMSIRVSGTDAAGRTVTETALDAYALETQ